MIVCAPLIRSRYQLGSLTPYISLCLRNEALPDNVDTASFRTSNAPRDGWPQPLCFRHAPATLISHGGYTLCQERQWASS